MSAEYNASMKNGPRKLLLTTLLTMAVALSGPPVMAGDHGHGHGSDRNGSDNSGQDSANTGISAEQAASTVRRAYGGRVVSVKPEGRNGQRIYKVRVLLDGGRVKTVQVDSNGNLSESN